MLGGKVSVTGAGAAISAINAVRSGWSNDTAWIVGVGAHYGAYVEFGTSRMQEQPYLFPAAEYVMRSEFQTIERRANSMDELVELLALAIEGEAKRRAPVDTGYLRSSIEAAPAGAMA